MMGKNPCFGNLKENEPLEELGIHQGKHVFFSQRHFLFSIAFWSIFVFVVFLLQKESNQINNLVPRTTSKKQYLTNQTNKQTWNHTNTHKKNTLKPNTPNLKPNKPPKKVNPPTERVFFTTEDCSSTSRPRALKICQCFLLFHSQMRWMYGIFTYKNSKNILLNVGI